MTDSVLCCLVSEHLMSSGSLYRCHDSYSAPDPVDDADFELSNGNTLVEAFMAGLAKAVDNDFRGLSNLLASLPDPSASHSQPEALSYSEARSKGLVSRHWALKFI